VNATFAVPADSAGARLDVFLVSVLGGQSRSHIQRLIKDGHVRVDGREAKPNLAMKTGQAVAVDIPDPVGANTQRFYRVVTPQDPAAAQAPASPARRVQRRK